MAGRLRHLARAVFIQRITPWPIEPPLQIWRCPMGVAFDGPAPLSPMERLYDITFKAEQAISVPDPTVPLVPVQADERADVDISGDEFDFVRSIRVYHIQFSQRQNRDGDCIRSDSTRLGSYGTQGDYRWTRSNVAQVPTSSDLPDRSATDRSSSIGGTMAATTASKKSDTEPSPGQRRVGLFL